MPALYTSLTVMTALKEAHQAGSPQPTTLVSYEAEIENVFDGRDQDALREAGIHAALPADASWRDRMKVAGEAKTRALPGGRPSEASTPFWRRCAGSAAFMAGG